jgi:predicted glycoside hydrolase/deacetylase ChbG (UPF0249 family)
VSRESLPGLLAPDGSLWPEVPPVLAHAQPAEVEAEIRAQVERAMKVGIKPTHLDSHMGTLFSPAYFAAYVKVARAYGLPFLAMRQAGASAAMLALLKETDIVPDSIAMATGGKPEEWTEFYLKTVRSLKPGLTELIVHLAHDDAEMQAITAGHPAYGSAWRQRDFDVITGAQFRQALKDNDVTLVSWRTLAARAAKQ